MRSNARSRLQFPPGFVWGAATSSYQIEGAEKADGRGESIWDRFCRVPGKVLAGDTGAVACDHYARFPADVALMKELGLTAYRFSISWPRVLPEGSGRINEKGLDFYDRLVDELLGAGITPFATLFHWDLPQAVQQRGGWPARATAEDFVPYVKAVANRIGNRVKHWITINEPWCVSMLSHQIGAHAPGIKDWSSALLASHHVLLAHGLAMRELRSVCPPDSQIGIALNLTPAVPETSSAADEDARRLYDGYFNRWFLDPIYGRGYPADMAEKYASLGYLPSNWDQAVRKDDLDAIRSPMDFLGVNYYRRQVVRARKVVDTGAEPFETVALSNAETTAIGWEVHPQGLFDILSQVHIDYAPARIFITENGASYLDHAAGDQVHDERRIQFLERHLAQAHRAVARGIPLCGYFVWSLLDNFEWEHGYSQRFGIVWVDYSTQRRIPKGSASWYRDVIATNSIVAESPDAAREA